MGLPILRIKRHVTRQRLKTPEDDHRIVPFRRRGTTSRIGNGWHWPRPTPPPTAPVEDLAKYEDGEAEDNYRHRMMVNLAALIFTILLGIVGAWLAVQIADMRKNQDCVLSGRRNCTPIDVKIPERG